MPRSASPIINKACEACRASKVRCSIGDNESECRRCLKSGRECIFNTPQPRKRRQLDPDSRVAELERQLKILKSRISKQQQSVAEPHSNNATRNQAITFSTPLTPDLWAHRAHKETIFNSDFIDIPAGSTTSLDVSSESGLYGIVSISQAQELLSTYRSNYELQYPFVEAPSEWGFKEFAENRPLTFLAILVATSAIYNIQVHTQLNQELMTVVTRSMMLDGQKSFDLVQAMIVMAVWYSPSEKLETLKHYQFAHLAATIAMDIDWNQQAQDNNLRRSPQPSREQSRTMLACYLLCTGISLAVGRPLMLRWSSLLDLSLASLEQSIDQIDRRLAAWTNLQRCAEKTVRLFFSPSSSINIATMEVQSEVDEAVKQLESWNTLLLFPLEGSMKLHYYQVTSRVLCICLYMDYAMEDFRPPFKIRCRDSEVVSASKLSPFYVRTMMRLLDTLHAALDTVIGMAPIDLLVSPIITYVRTCHALTVLLMIAMLILREDHILSKVIDLQSTKIDHYLAQAIEATELARKTNNHETPLKFKSMLERMRDWWIGQLKHDPQQMYDLRPFLTSPASSKETRLNIGYDEHAFESSGYPCSTEMSANATKENSSGSEFSPTPYGISPFADWMDTEQNDLTFMDLPDLHLLPIDFPPNDIAVE